MGSDEHGPAYPEPPYACPTCRGDEHRYLECNHPGCPDGRDWGHPVAKRWARYRETYPTAEEVARRYEPSFMPGWFLIVLLIIIVTCLTWPALAAKGYEPNSSPTVSWFESLPRPDMPSGYSCCGKADAYPVDRYWPNGDGSFTAVIADGSAKKYPDGTERPYVAAGTEVIVPKERINDDKHDLDNPTDFSWVFIRVLAGNVQQVYCFVRHPSGN